MASPIDDQLEKLKNKGQREIFTPSKGLMSVLRESRDLEDNSSRTLTNIFSSLAKHHEDKEATLNRIDFGVGKLNKIVSDAMALNQSVISESFNHSILKISDSITASSKSFLTALSSSKPDTITGSISQGSSVSEKHTLTFYQSTLEFLSLNQIYTEDLLQLTRGLLANATKIVGFLDRAENARELAADKKQFKAPTRIESKKNEEEGLGIMDLLAGLGLMKLMKAIFVRPIKLIGEILEKAARAVITPVKNMFAKTWKSFSQAFAKAFPKTTEFLKGIKNSISGFVKKITSKLPSFVDDGLKKIPALLKGSFAKILGKAGPIAMAIDMVYNFFQGWFNAKEITGEDKVALKDKIISGVMGMLSSLTFGFIKPKDWYEVIMGDYGLWWHLKSALTSVWEMFPDSLRNALSGVGNIFSFAFGEADKVFMQFSGGWSMSEVLMRLLDDVAAWIEEKVTFKNLNPMNWFSSDDSKEVKTVEDLQLAKSRAKLAQGRTIPKHVDSSSKHMSDKKALEANKNTAQQTLVQVPPPTVIQAPAPTVMNMFEADINAILTGGVR